MAIEAINAVRQVTQWLEKTVIDLNFCPFARKPFDRGGIHFSVVVDRKDRQVLEQLLIECQALVSKPEYDTTLMILSSGYDDFYRYLELLDMAQQLFQQGMASQLQVLDSQSASDQAELGLYQAYFEYNSARASLARALGEK